MIVRVLGASALAVILMAPAAQAAHRHHHGSFAGYRHYPVARFSAAPHRVAYRRYWTRARMARRDDFGSRHEAAGQDFAEHRTFQQTRVSGGRPHAWCGWYARGLVGQDPGPSYNLARNWAHWGRASGPGVGVMVVWPHHVGMITGRSSNGEWIVKSGNDGGGMARERPRSISGAIAFRAG
jgi:hypothetical protein